MRRTMAAILAADVAGYSRFVAEDEEGALRRLSVSMQAYREEVAKLGGRVFNTAGDAILAEFPSAVEALRAAVAIQERLRTLDPDDPPERRLRFRMGLTIGDVVEREDGDMLGDGVNVAARLEGIAEPGGICISRSVHEAVANKVPVTFRDIGPQRLKNINRPVHAFRVVLPFDAAGRPAGTSRGSIGGWGAAALALGLLAIGGGGGAAWYWRDRAAPVVPPSSERDDLISVSVAPTRQACFEDRIWMNGIVEPRRTVDVRPDRRGLQVLRVLAEPLAQVTAGQLLAELVRPDDPEQRAIPLRSPVEGVIGSSTVRVGAPAPVDGPALFQVFDRGEFELAADVALAGLAQVRPNQEAAVTPLGLGEIPGRVRLVGDGVDPTTQLGRARITLKGTGGLHQGLFARAAVNLGRRCGLGVPLSAIAHETDAAIVYVVNGQHIEARSVVTGLSAGELVEIREGVTGNDVIVQHAGPFLRDGDAVRAIPVKER